MRRRTLLFLFVILLLGIGAFYVDFGFGKQPSIDFGGYKNSLTVNQGLDLKGGVQLVMTAQCPQNKPNCDFSQYMNSVVDNINRRIAGGLAVNDAVVRLEGTGSGANRVLIELPGLTDVTRAEQLLGTTGQMNIIDSGSQQLQVRTTAPPCPANANPCPSGTYKVVFTGDQLDANSVSATLDQNNQPVVLFAFSGNAKSKFGTYTGSHVGQFLTITLDNVVIESATIREEIDGQGQISGLPTIADAQNLASYLRYGALPLPLQISSENVLAPTLGQQALDSSKRAAIIGLGMVMLFMLIYYRLPGLLADLALCLYAMFLFAMIKLLGVTLSLPGIAAVILTIGMAVDANVLIFERVKEELRAGRTMAAAIDIGFKRAWPSIRDSNASTMITCAILYWFGNNFGATIIVGFAVNLFIGVAISLFTAVVVTRNFLNVLLYFNLGTHPVLFGLPQSALSVGRYNRPVSRVSARPGRAVIAPSRPAEPELAVDDEETEVSAEDDEQALEQAGNTANGRVPASSRSGASGATQGTEE
jgi:preprotein translocase subunit SecD